MKKGQKRESLLLPKLLKKIAPKVNARVFVEPKWGVVGQITFPAKGGSASGGKDGRKRYFRYNTLDLNPVGSSDVAKDKDYANFFMRKMGYPAVPSRAFYSDDWCDAIGSKRNTRAALRYAQKIGFPVFAKPNSGSHGKNVFRAENARELRRALKEIFHDDKVMLVQKPIEGHDYRIVVLDNDVISAYERIPLNVVGDGYSTIAQLLKKKQRQFIVSSRDTRIKFDDPRIKAKLRHQRISPNSILLGQMKVYLLDNANLSSGGDAVDVTKAIHPAFKKLAIQLTRDMGLRLCGVDLMVQGSLAEKPRKYWILEVNAAPGLDHYVKTGKAQQKIVEKMYLKVLKAMSR